MTSTVKTKLITTNVKQEKIDPEIEKKISLLKVKIRKESPSEKNASNNVSLHDNHSDRTLATKNGDADKVSSEVQLEQEDEKKNIEPLKSSNEILAELFKVFNAAPPKQLLDDKDLIEKAQKHKKRKNKKKKKRERKLKEYKEKLKEYKKKEHEKLKSNKIKTETSKEKSHRDHSSERDNHKNKYKNGSKDDSSEASKSGSASKEDQDKSKFLERKRHKTEFSNDNKPNNEPQHKKCKAEPDVEKAKNNFYNGYKEHELKKETNNRNKSKTKDTPTAHKNRNEDVGESSEISLSDEETYLREKEQHLTVDPKRSHYERDHSKYSTSNSYSRSNNSFYVGAERSISRDRDNRYYRHDTRRHRSHTRSRSKSRSRSRSRDLGIDKKRLLEIARKNAISMFKRGNLPGSANMSEEIRDKVLMKMRYGGRTVQDLTDFCKKISSGENLSDLSSDEDSDMDKNGNAKAFHHPFQVREREPIVMHIRNATAIVPRKPAEDQTKAITMQFPVSSGQHHRLTEAAWVPVEPREKLMPLPSLPLASQSTTIFKSATPKNVFEKPIPKQMQQEPAFKPVCAPIDLPQPCSVSNVTTLEPIVTNAATTVPTAAINIPPPTVPVAVTPPSFVPDVPIPSTAQTVRSMPPQTQQSIFPNHTQNSYDVATLITMRLSAVRRLQENPTDPEAIKLMYNSQREMSAWASSKHLPGQFTGSTGVKVLKVHELNSGPQVWTRRNQLTDTKPVSGGMGMHLLQKMGWKPGEGLGREKTGSLQPLLLDVKLDKRGLISKEDNSNNRLLPPRKRINTIAQEDLKNKHPVSLLNEITSKYKWSPPIYQIVNEEGPMHSKMFLFSVSVNGRIFTPDRGSSTKKESKMIAARYCLQEMGLIPKQKPLAAVTTPTTVASATTPITLTTPTIANVTSATTSTVANVTSATTSTLANVTSATTSTIS